LERGNEEGRGKVGWEEGDVRVEKNTGQGPK
jgi:hypothetical protein